MFGVPPLLRNADQSNADQSNADQTSPTQQPNIVLFFVDDLGWADLGYRAAKFNTPSVDQLVADGFISAAERKAEFQKASKQLLLPEQDAKLAFAKD